MLQTKFEKQTQNSMSNIIVKVALRQYLVESFIFQPFISKSKIMMTYKNGLIHRSVIDYYFHIFFPFDLQIQLFQIIISQIKMILSREVVPHVVLLKGSLVYIGWSEYCHYITNLHLGNGVKGAPNFCWLDINLKEEC